MTAKKLPSPPIIIMIHGAWHWGGCFSKVANLLATEGYIVLLPDLAGHGYSELVCEDIITMADYVAPVESIIKKVHSKVILVGHSMGGASLTYLAERHPHKIASLVYLAAFMTPTNTSPLDYILHPTYVNDKASMKFSRIVYNTSSLRGVLLDLSQKDIIKHAFYADCSEKDISVALSNMNALTPSIPYSTINTLSSHFFNIDRHYIECHNDYAIPLAQQIKMQTDVPGATKHTLNTSHSPFFSAADELAEIIAKITSGVSHHVLSKI